MHINVYIYMYIYIYIYKYQDKYINILWSIFGRVFMLFLEALSESIFWRVKRRCRRQGSTFSAFLDFDRFRNRYSERPFSSRKVAWSSAYSVRTPSLPRPCFSRNHNNYFAVWTNGFLKVIVSIEIGSFSVFVCFSLVYVLYTIFITFVHKSSVNAQPLSPPIWKKFSPLFKKRKAFSLILFLLRLILFTFYICSLFFEYPLPPPPWARLVRFVVDFGPTIVRFW